jgi:hypothetical protein
MDREKNNQNQNTTSRSNQDMDEKHTTRNGRGVEIKNARMPEIEENRELFVDGPIIEQLKGLPLSIGSFLLIYYMNTHIHRTVRENKKKCSFLTGDHHRAFVVHRKKKNIK